jgi:hypothetical protein
MDGPEEVLEPIVKSGMQPLISMIEERRSMPAIRILLAISCYYANLA